ncbi:PAS domain-containing protein [Guptibacillus algicola]|uniref:PAS domain-containing protein n=1 Tax=Guptibacillus algicola TaxID=225844 RepID=UPI001CD3F0FD|nr:PAS domain-containing protein [Alkalihalobacillus algicola]MCA0987336.1 PAS domain-containing protein [Alkalihalobacillus algicola]
MDMNGLSRAILDKLSYGVLAIDNDYRITLLNKAGADLLELSPDEVLGENMYEVFEGAPEEVRHVERTVKTHKEYFVDVMPYHYGKYEKYLSIQTRLLRESDTVVGAFVEFTDVSNLYKKQLQLVSRVESLSVNVIPLSEGVAVLPLQSTMDEFEFNHIIDKGVERVSELRVNELIIDLSAIGNIDPVLLANIQKLVNTISIIGTNVMITGIRPSVAIEWTKSNEGNIQARFYSNLGVALKDVFYT